MMAYEPTNLAPPEQRNRATSGSSKRSRQFGLGNTGGEEGAQLSAVKQEGHMLLLVAPPPAVADPPTLLLPIFLGC